MKVMIITPNPEDPEIQLLTKEFRSRGYFAHYFIPSRAKVLIFKNGFLKTLEKMELKAALVRGFGIAPAQKIFFRLDILTVMEVCGIRLINSRESLEIASDKFLTSMLLEKHGIPTPRTIVCENAEDALTSLDELGGDVILKPLYGSKGIGVTRINDKAFGENVIYALAQLNHVFYLQEFIEHNNRDIRILVLGDNVIAGMYRVSDNWKTNIHAGGKMEKIELTDELKDLAIKAAKITKTEIAGVDIIESPEGYKVIEVNSIPGFTALQKVSKINIASEIVSYFLKTILA
ncbi:MAG: RimK family alpha-L-glutamate ligase [Promethearchaeota archaeon]